MEYMDVLIVDDQAPFRDIARTIIGSLAGWRVVAEAETATDALNAARRVMPEVVLMDINLPDLNGIAATRLLLADRPCSRVILLSTYAADDLPSDAKTCGAIAFLSKEDLTSKALLELL
jgi:two-component system invasion response regulator UvrY